MSQAAEDAPVLRWPVLGVAVAAAVAVCSYEALRALCDKITERL